MLDFTSEYKKHAGILHSATKKYRTLLDVDDIKSCQQIALWKAIQTYNGSIKLTSHIYNLATWECLKRIRENQTCGDKELGQTQAKDNTTADLSFLSEDLQRIIELRYVHRMTLNEIANLFGFSRETARKMVNRARETIRMVYNIVE